MQSLVKKICQQLDAIIYLLNKSKTKCDEAVCVSGQDQLKEDTVELPVLLDIHEVIAILNIPVAIYYRWVRLGELVPRRKEKRHYFYKEDLLQQLKEGRRRGRI